MKKEDKLADNGGLGRRLFHEREDCRVALFQLTASLFTTICHRDKSTRIRLEFLEGLKGERPGRVLKKGRGRSGSEGG